MSSVILADCLLGVMDFLSTHLLSLQMPGARESGLEWERSCEQKLVHSSYTFKIPLGHHLLYSATDCLPLFTPFSVPHPLLVSSSPYLSTAMAVIE